MKHISPARFTCSLIILLLTVSSQLLFAGGFDNLKLKKADRHFENYQFVSAIELYESLVDKIDSNSRTHVYQRLADAYWNIDDDLRAEVYYGKLVEIDRSNSRNLYRYILSLKGNQRYSDANDCLKKFCGLTLGDSRAKHFEENQNYLQKLKADSSRFDVIHLEVNSEEADFSPTYYGEKVVFVSEKNKSVKISPTYSWNERPYVDLFIFETDSSGQLFGKVSRFNNDLNSRFHDGPVCFDAAGTMAFYTKNSTFKKKLQRSNDGVNHLSLMTAKLQGTSWTDITPFPFNSAEYSTGHPAWSNNDGILYFISDMPGGLGGTDIYKSKYTGGSWTEPVNLGPQINTEGNEMFPFIHENGTLYFASDGFQGLGGLDIYEAIEDSLGNWDASNMGFPLNGPKDDFGLIVNKAGNFGYFSSNRPGGLGYDDIYATKIGPKRFPSLKGKVYDQISDEPIDSVFMYLINKGQKIDSAYTDDKGKYKFEVHPNQTYTLQLFHEDYQDEEETVKAETPGERLADIILDISMLEATKYKMIGEIIEKSTMMPLVDVDVFLENKTNGETQNTKTGTDGKFEWPLNRADEYDVRMEKENYFSKSREVSIGKEEPGVLYIKEYFERIEVNKAIEIENIYFDFNKWNIRKDAARELDHIAKLLRDNPNVSIEMGSHTDSRGSNKSNQILSQKRAESTVNYLVKTGIDRSRLRAKGYGEDVLRNECADGVKCSEEKHQQNRRTEFKVTSIDKK